MSWSTHHCRCCGMPHIKMKPIGIKKRSEKQIYDGTLHYIKNLGAIHDRPKHWTNFFWAEEIARHLQVKTHFVKQVLHKLNLEGIVTQPEHRPPHDSTRDRWGGYDSAWMGDIYHIR